MRDSEVREPRVVSGRPRVLGRKVGVGRSWKLEPQVPIRHGLFNGMREKLGGTGQE